MANLTKIREPNVRFSRNSFLSNHRERTNNAFDQIEIDSDSRGPDSLPDTLIVRMLDGLLPYQGGAPMIGQGGASKRIDGVDIWLFGAPPRKFQIIGYIEDSRPGGPPSMAQRNPKLAATAKQQGGDGVLIQSDAALYMGSISTGNAFTTVNGSFYGNGFNGSALTTGTLVSAPMIRREGRFFVIKYL